MPINRATRNNTSIPTVELGRIRKGAPKTGNKPGAELDYFRVDWNADSPYFGADPFLKDHCEDAWLSLYGQQPTLLTGAQFVANSIDAVFPNWYTEYKRSQSGESLITRRCDGDHLEREFKGRDTAFYGNLPTHARPRCVCDPENRACKPDAKLIFILPEFIRLTGVPGHFILITHSIVDVMNIYASLEFAQSALGRLQGVAFNLSREKKKIKGYVKYACVLSLGDIAAQNAALQMSEAAGALPEGNGQTFALPSGQQQSTDVPEGGKEVAFKPQVEVKAVSNDEGEVTFYYGLTDIDGESTYWTPNVDLLPIPMVLEYDPGLHTLKEVSDIPTNMVGHVGKKGIYKVWLRS